MLQQCNNSVTTPKNCIELRISRKKVARSGGLTEHMMCFLALSWLFAKPTGTFMIWKCPAMPPNGRKGAKRVHGNASPSTVYRAHVRAMYRHDAKGPHPVWHRTQLYKFRKHRCCIHSAGPNSSTNLQQVFWASRPKFHFHPGLLRKGSWRGWWRKRKGSPRWFDLSHIQPYRAIWGWVKTLVPSEPQNSW